jgi:hypothetical protein
MSAYTKGPWVAGEPGTEDEDYVQTIHGNCVASVYPGDSKWTSDSSLANTNLIAAAPELYEAAIDFLNGYCKEPSEAFHARMSDLAFRFRLATSKAEGK